MDTKEKPITNMKKVNKLLDTVDWAKVVIPRRQKFVLSYLRNGKDIRAVAKEFDFSVNDMLNIFLRIQRELEAVAEPGANKGVSNAELYDKYDELVRQRGAELRKWIGNAPQENIDGLPKLQRELVPNIRKGRSCPSIEELSKLHNKSKYEIAENLFGERGIINRLLEAREARKLERQSAAASVKTENMTYEERLAKVLATVTNAEKNGIDVEKVLKPNQLQAIECLKKGYSLERTCRELNIQNKTLYMYLWGKNSRTQSVLNKLRKYSSAS